jgi:predicted dehydrogenase
MADRADTVFFDAGTTQMRPTLLAQAIRAGKHVYCEKPIATNLSEALEVCRLAQQAGVKHGAVQDKLFLPGLRKLDMLSRAGFFGRILSVRIEFGYWVFEGDLQPIQRPVVELPRRRRRRHHPRHAVPLALRAGQPVRRGAGGVVPRRHAHPERWDEAGQPYRATADDAAYATSSWATGEPVIAQVNSRGRRACGATTSSPSTSTARTARRSPACTDCRSQARVNDAAAGVEPGRSRR